MTNYVPAGVGPHVAVVNPTVRDPEVECHHRHRLDGGCDRLWADRRLQSA
jgi:hypothetical protein